MATSTTKPTIEALQKKVWHDSSKPTVDAFLEHMRACERCRTCCEAWWGIKDPTTEQMKAKLDLCDAGRAILRSLFN